MTPPIEGAVRKWVAWRTSMVHHLINPAFTTARTYCGRVPREGKTDQGRLVQIRFSDHHGNYPTCETCLRLVDR